LKTDKKHIVCIGAGPSGLTAAYLLSKKGFHVDVYEANPVSVGGISRTVRYKNFLFDIGGHRFFSESKEVNSLWNEILKDDFLTRPRVSRIYYRNSFFSYPLRPIEALSKLGILQSCICILSFLKAQLKPIKNPINFEQWVTNQFGKKLYNIFFKSYTEKVWGMKCHEISADWAAQRIKGLSLFVALKESLLPNKDRVIKTLIHQFKYPAEGPGMMWEEMAKRVKKYGNNIFMGEKVNKLHFINDTKKWTIITQNGEKKVVDQVISSAPLRTIIQNITPKPPETIIHASQQLQYRDFITVCLIIKKKNVFNDNWIYIHDPSVKVGRIQNYKNWSPKMVPDQDLTGLGLEYFCFEGDQLWESSDNELIERAKKDLCYLNLVKSHDIQDGHVIRQKKAYPIYDDQYKKNVNIIQTHVEKYYPGLHFVGRNGMHKYNNQDHAMLSSMLTVDNLLKGEKIHDIWSIDENNQYLEEKVKIKNPLVPSKIPDSYSLTE